MKKPLIVLLAIVVGLGILYWLGLKPHAVQLGKKKTIEEVFSNPNLRYVPSEVISVAVFDSKSDAAKKMRNSPFSKIVEEAISEYNELSKEKSIKELLQEALPQDKISLETSRIIEKAITLLDATPKDIISYWPESERTSLEGLTFQTLSADKNRTDFTFLQSFQKSDLWQRLYKEWSKNLREIGIIIQESQESGFDTYSLQLRDIIYWFLGDSIPQTAHAALDYGLHLGVGDTLVLFSTDKVIFTRIVQGQADPNPLQISNKTYQKLAEKLAYSPSNHYSYSFEEPTKLLTAHLEPLKESLRQNASGQEQEIVDRALMFIDNFPNVIKATVSGYDRGFMSESLFDIRIKDDLTLIRPWLAALKPKQVGTNSFIPINPIFAVSFHTEIFRFIYENYLKDLPQLSEHTQHIDSLSGISEIGFAFQYVLGEEIYPSIYLALSSAEAAAIEKRIVEALDNARTLGNQLPIGSWIKKTIDGQPVMLAASPLGIGLYIFTHKDGLVLSSSEVGIRRVIQAISQKEQSFQKQLASLEHAGALDCAFHFYFDFATFVQTLDGAMKTFGAVLPNKPPNLPELGLKATRSIGSVSSTIGADGEFLRSRMSQRAASE